MIVCFLVMKLKCFLFDEFILVLDFEMIDDVLNVMKSVVEDFSMIMLVVIYEMGFVCEVVDWVIFMVDGEILEDDVKEKFFDG